MKLTTLLSIGYLLMLVACSPVINKSVNKCYPVLDFRDKVYVFGLNDPIYGNYEELGECRIGDSGFTLDCGWEKVIDLAQLEARKVGGNAIKVINHRLPSILGSSCHNIVVEIIRLEELDVALQDTSFVMEKALNTDPIPADTAKIETDNLDMIPEGDVYAVLHIYRPGGMGSFLNYDLYLGNMFLCRVTHRSKQTIKIRKEGANHLWAKTETKTEIPIRLESGKEYYLRCGVGMGVTVGYPTLELVDNEIGHVEIQSPKLKEKVVHDKLFLKDGRTIECDYLSEDKDDYHVTISLNGKSQESLVQKAQVQSIQRNN